MLIEVQCAVMQNKMIFVRPYVYATTDMVRFYFLDMAGSVTFLGYSDLCKNFILIT